MDLNFDTIYDNFTELVKGPVIDLSNVKIMSPWAVGIVCLLLIERHSESSKKLILPASDKCLMNYLKEMNFDNILKELGYEKEFEILNKIKVSELNNKDVPEILHCKYIDEFSGRLGRINRMFQRFGLNEDDALLATNIVAELGNNVFDHNWGSWPTDIGGCIITAQNYPQKQIIEVAIGDPGVGFRKSLSSAFPELKSDIEAIKKGLAGNTGRVGETRGNGLKFIQQWTIENFSGKLFIHSGDGLVTVDKDGSKEKSVDKILGTLVQFVIQYK